MIDVEASQQCPRCGNRLLFDRQRSLTYCKYKTCQGLITEFGHISYEQEVNLHDDDQGPKQTRFGGYESKKDQFVSRLLELLQNSDSRGRERLYKKFNGGEHIIHRLTSQFEIKEAIMKEMLMKYRELLITHISEKIKLPFDVVAVVAVILIAQEKRKHEWAGTPQKNLTPEIICEFADISVEKAAMVTRRLSLNHDRAHIKQKELDDLMKSSMEFPFNDEEMEAIRKFYDNLMNSSLIKGQKPTTLYRLFSDRNTISVVQLCICQLSPNPILNHQTLEQISAKNGVTRETIRSIWNRIVEPLATTSSDLVPHWYQRRPIADLRPVN